MRREQTRRVALSFSSGAFDGDHGEIFGSHDTEDIRLLSFLFQRGLGAGRGRHKRRKTIKSISAPATLGRVFPEQPENAFAGRRLATGRAPSTEVH
jgi:hypothetical protein